MNTQFVADKLEITELTNKLFMYVDALKWQQLLDEVFEKEVFFDMSSAGGGKASKMAAKDICEIWRQGFEGLDAVHHQAGHYLINVNGNESDIYGYAVALHYKKDATKGDTRTFVGSYDLRAKRTAKGWRLTQFQYHLKYLDGNIALE